jgi:hypothetical protein
MYINQQIRNQTISIVMLVCRIEPIISSTKLDGAM